MKTCFKFLMTFLILTVVLTLNGCNTTAGFGKDLQRGGQNIQRAAQK